MGGLISWGGDDIVSGVPKIRDAFFGNPSNKDYSIWGSRSGAPNLKPRILQPQPKVRCGVGSRFPACLYAQIALARLPLFITSGLAYRGRGSAGGQKRT